MKKTKEEILTALQPEVERIVLRRLFNDIMSNLGLYLVLKRLPLVEVENIINTLPEIIRPKERYVATMGEKSEDGKIVIKEYDKTKPLENDLIRGILLDLSKKMMSEPNKNNESLTDKSLYKEFDVE